MWIQHIRLTLSKLVSWLHDGVCDRDWREKAVRPRKQHGVVDTVRQQGCAQSLDLCNMALHCGSIRAFHPTTSESTKPTSRRTTSRLPHLLDLVLVLQKRVANWSEPSAVTVPLLLDTMMA
jgi:hypothetical protein